MGVVEVLWAVAAVESSVAGETAKRAVVVMVNSEVGEVAR